MDETQRAMLERLEAIDKRLERLEEHPLVECPVRTIGSGIVVGLVAAGLLWLLLGLLTSALSAD